MQTFRLTEHIRVPMSLDKQGSAVMLSYNMVVLYSKDRYEIIGLRKSSHSIKQPCNSIYLKKIVCNASKLLK